MQFLAAVRSRAFSHDRETGDTSVSEVLRHPPDRANGSAAGYFRWWALPTLPPAVMVAFLLALTTTYLLPLVLILYRIGDDGTLIYGAQRVSEGAIPGRDFFEVMGPGSFYWMGAFFRLFGSSWLVTRFLVLLEGVATAGLLYVIARRVSRESTALALWLFVVVVGLPLWPTVSHHWDSNFFAIAAVWCFLKFEERGHRGCAVAAGILTGVTACVMQQKGIFLLLALIASHAIRRRLGAASLSMPSTSIPNAKPGSIWLLCGSFAAVGIGVLTAYWRAGALADLYYANFTWPLSNYHGINVSSYGQMLATLAITPAYLAFGPDRPVAGILCGILSLIPFLLIGILPLLAAGSALACLLTADKRRDWLRGPLLTLTLAGAAMWFSEIHRRDIFHLIYGSPILLIVLLASAQRILKNRLANALIAIVAAGLLVFGFFNFEMHLRGSHQVETRRGTIQSASDEGALRFLCTTVKKREFVFVYPYYPVYYYLADVRNPTRFSILLYGYNTPDQFAEVMRNLEEKRVRYVLWDQEVSGVKLRTWFPSYRQPPNDELKLEHYLQANYEMIGLKSGFRILQRRIPADTNSTH